MRLFIDIDTLTLIEGPTDRRIVSRIQAKRGDHLPLTLQFLRNGQPVRLASSTVVTFGAKPLNQFDADPVVLDATFAQSAAPTDPEEIDDAKWTASPSLNTFALNDLFLIDGDPTNDPQFVDLSAEFTWIADGDAGPTTIRTVVFRVLNDVVRGDEGTPLELPTPAQWLLGATTPTNGEPPTATLNPAGDDNDILLTDSSGTRTTAQIVIDAVTDRTQIAASETAGAVVFTSGDKRLLTVSGAVTAGVNGTLTKTAFEAANEWSSNGLTLDENDGVNAFTHVIDIAGDVAVISYDAAGVVIYQANVEAEQSHDWPDEYTFDAPTVGEGTPTVTAAPALASTAIAMLDALEDLTAENADGSDGSGSIAAVGPVDFEGLPATAAPPFLRVADGFLYIQEGGVWKKTALSEL